MAPVSKTEPSSDITTEGRQYYQQLYGYFSKLSTVVVAFSGGVDSALLLYTAVAALGKDNARGIIGVSASLPGFELEEALRFAAEFDLPLEQLETRELENENYTANPHNRCYFCKSELFDRLNSWAAENNVAAIVDGTHAGELKGHRPGHSAGRERGVLTPLAELNFDKEHIRAAARWLGLPLWDKPSFACLSSRLPTGTRVDQKRLERIGRGETFLHRAGFRQFRLRDHHPVARIELDQAGIERLLADPALRQAVVDEVKASGFTFVTLDLCEFKSGSLSRAGQPDRVDSL